MSRGTGVIGQSAFDRATAGRCQDPYDELTEIEIDHTWGIGDKPHGGYLVAAIARAVADHFAGMGKPHRHPLSTASVFLRAPDFGPAQITTEIRRIGRSLSFARSMLAQDGRECVEVLCTFGTLDAGAQPWLAADPAPAIPAWDDCVPLPRKAVLPDGTTLRIGIAEVTEVRVDPASMRALAHLGTTRPVAAAKGEVPEPGRSGELLAWLGFADGRDHDPLSLLFVLDALPPVTFTLGVPGWVPTLQYTTYVRGMPAPGPVLVRQRARLIQDNRIDEVCDVWDATGRLVGQATQLAAVRIPGL